MTSDPTIPAVAQVTPSKRSIAKPCSSGDRSVHVRSIALLDAASATTPAGAAGGPPGAREFERALGIVRRGLGVLPDSQPLQEQRAALEGQLARVRRGGGR